MNPVAPVNFAMVSVPSTPPAAETMGAVASASSFGGAETAGSVACGGGGCSFSAIA